MVGKPEVIADEREICVISSSFFASIHRVRNGCLNVVSKRTFLPSRRAEIQLAVTVCEKPLTYVRRINSELPGIQPCITKRPLVPAEGST